MAQRVKWMALGFVSALAIGYMLPRPAHRNGDILDAVAAVQRRAPRFLISEPLPPARWAHIGAVYLCRNPKSVAEIEAMSKYPWDVDPSWTGVVCIQGTNDPNRRYLAWLSDGGDRCLNYGGFAVFGDPEMINEVSAILTAEGFHVASHP
jgi:hypothetical protein